MAGVSEPIALRLLGMVADHEDVLAEPRALRLGRATLGGTACTGIALLMEMRRAYLRVLAISPETPQQAWPRLFECLIYPANLRGYLRSYGQQTDGNWAFGPRGLRGR